MKHVRGFSIGSLLLAALVGGICLIPMHGQQREFPPIWTSVVVLATSALATAIVSGRRWGGAVAGLGLAAILVYLAVEAAGQEKARILPGFLFAASTAISAVAIANAAFSRRTRGDDRICHGVTSYLLIGIAFAMIHQDRKSTRLNSSHRT